MSAPAALRGTFSDFKLIRGRKCAQIVIEVPLEQADAALQALGGLPNPADERWVAVARLNPEANQKKPAEQKERRRFNELPAASQIAIACQSESYREYLRFRYVAEWIIGEADAGQWVKNFLGVKSKREVVPGSPAFAAWVEHYGSYEVWLKYERAA